MEQRCTLAASRRLVHTLARAGATILVCLLGTVACLPGAEDASVDARQTVRTPTPAWARSRDARAAGGESRAQPAAPAQPTPTFVPTGPTQPAPAEPVPEQATPPPEPAQPEPATVQPGPAQVVYGGEEGLNLRSEPNQQKIAALLKGSRITIRGPAREEGGFRWWPVAVEAGWIAEGSRDPARERWLVPADGERVEPGRQARVAYPGKDGLNIRRTPGPGGEKLATLLHGSLVTVIGGPEEVDGVAWWQVQVAEGWLSEGRIDASQPRWISMRR